MSIANTLYDTAKRKTTYVLKYAAGSAVIFIIAAIIGMAGQLLYSPESSGYLYFVGALMVITLITLSEFANWMKANA